MQLQTLASSLFIGFSLFLNSLQVQAASPTGLRFSHNDWELACDNTRTCRAAGYQSDENEQTVSVLLTRKAGPRQAVKGELQLGNFGDEDALSQWPSVLKLTMRINGRSLGQVLISKDSLTADLSGAQVAALLAALPRKSSIEWTAGKLRWQLSDQGAAAVLLKMDEFQGRIGTQGALIKKGPLGEGAVLAPLPAPIVIAAALTKPRPTDDQLASKQSKFLREELRASDTEGECSGLTEGKADLFITRLTSTKLLVSTQCWSGAYNTGDGYWVINDKPPYQPILVTTSGSDFNESSISVSQKGRGIGDCWYSEDWTWDGKTFVHTREQSTGMCKSIAAGGAWSLPTLVTDVRGVSR
jgi:hypothetical protein